MVDSETARRYGKKPAVRRDLVTDGYRHDVPWDDLRRIYAVDFARAEYIGLVWRVLHQGLHAQGGSVVVS